MDSDNWWKQSGKGRTAQSTDTLIIGHAEGARNPHYDFAWTGGVRERFLGCQRSP